MQSKYIVPAISFVGAIVAAVLVNKLLARHVSEALRQGAGFYAMWLCLYPAVKFWSRKKDKPSPSRKRPLTFLWWAIIGVLSASIVTILYILLQ